MSKIFFHSADLDGMCSGAIVKKAYPQAELVGINYGDKFPWDTIGKYERVFMVDFTLQPFEDMERLNELSCLSWIDHHKTAIEEAEKRNFKANFGQKLEIGRAACELTWEALLFYKGNEVVHLLGRYDVWDLVPNTLELQNGLGLYDTHPSNSELWDDLLSPNSKIFPKALEDGKILLQKQQMDDIAYAKEFAFETEIDGLNVIVVNKGLTGSLIFDSVYDPARHDAMMVFVWGKDIWTISLYSAKKEIDVGEICKAHGGGGHLGAGGFSCDYLPFRLKGE